MASPFLLLSLASIFSLLLISSSSTSSPYSVTLSLTPFAGIPHADPKQALNRFVSASLSRAHHLKQPKATASVTKTPLFPRSYGAYSVTLGFGTPPQSIPLLMDTGSSLTWVPCTQRYICAQCNFPTVNSSNISVFLPKLSSSAKILGCRNPKCGWFYGLDVGSRCPGCERGSNNCTQTCPNYEIVYGSGLTLGLLLSETLDLPGNKVGDFVVGCSILSIRQPAGIVGFGRGQESLPSQLGLRKFSYCLVSHRFDDNPQSSDLVLVSGSASGDGKSSGISYTPFRKNPSNSKAAFLEFYYLTLRKISVGGKGVKIPYTYLVPGADGNGGTIIDSGTTLTFMDGEIHNLVAKEFENQMSNYSRSLNFEAQSGLRPCFNISGEERVTFPELVFHFKGGAEMQLPLADYFSFVDDTVVCMTLVTNNVNGRGNSSGPSIILGNYQQQNFYIEYDLENERLGFRKQICK